jgi:NDP-sugar pyrophosphorylase family protein
MILAAGYGSRLRPLTAALPKPLVPVVNRPLLEHIIASVRAAGIRELVINLHYRGAQIRRWLGRGERLGVEVTYSEEPQLLGSAGGVRRVRDFFGDEPALIVHGDLLFDVDLRAVIAYHRDRTAHATLVLHPAYHRFDYGIIKVNAQGEIGQFVDHQAPGVAGPFTATVFTGVQILDPVVLDTIPAQGIASLTTEVYPRLLGRPWRFYGYLMRGYWSDIGTPRRYWEANLDVLNGAIAPPAGQPPRQLHQPRTHAPVALHPTAVVARDAHLGPAVVVGEGCAIGEGARLRYSVLWPRVRVQAGAMVERSIVMNDVTIPAQAQVVEQIVSASGMTPLSA